ncbi:hypothetical protein OHB00_03110 [Streptomyces sp. NBC_00631]|uniref:hypothetical protein n=1 Tax=Streptomyces sp. NBC_00631 TaxID=2975793 RepID=UPI0030E5C337
MRAPVAESPAVGVVTSRDRLEPTLLAAGGVVRFGTELVPPAGTTLRRPTRHCATP